MLLPFFFVLHVVCCIYSATANASIAFSDKSLLWGPYRPNLYVGFRPRIPNSTLIGLMWANADDPMEIPKNLRHTCEQDEGMAGYGWTFYDVRSGGTHVVNDTGNKLDLTTSFTKVMNGNSHSGWGLRISGHKIPDAPQTQRTTVIFYFGMEEPITSVECTSEQITKTSNRGVLCTGSTVRLGPFTLRLSDLSASTSLLSTSVRSRDVPVESIWQAKKILVDDLQSDSSSGGMIADAPGRGNLHYIQKTFQGDFEFDVLYSSQSTSENLTSSTLTSSIQDTSARFYDRFKSTYLPQPPFQNEKHGRFSQSLLSNLLGGIGYFYGKSKVDTSQGPGNPANTEDRGTSTFTPVDPIIMEEGPYELYSSVPSRPFFPRGFLWDEGFHLQVILDWDMDLALEIVTSWFDLMNEDGWIAREQILGPEARSKVPEEFQIQYSHYANPPTMFIVLQAFVQRLDGTIPYSGAPSRFLKDAVAGKAFLTSIYPKLVQHCNWFRRTQAGTNLTTYEYTTTHDGQGYQWRGRTSQHVLTSGLDDYPRGRPLHPGDLHLDALCWVGTMAMALEYITAFLHKKGDVAVFSSHVNDVARAVESIHWSNVHQAHCDATIKKDSQVDHVCHKGYISLFPFITKLIGPNSSHLEAVLDLIRDPKELWSPYGLRSLSLKDEYYGTDENYWRSPVWININYMVVERLLELAQQPGPHQRKARQTYIDLRQNLVNTVFNSWEDTGFAWEQYNPATGKGQRTQHFTGWTALIVRVMAMPDLRPENAPNHLDQPKLTHEWQSQSVLVLVLLLLCLWYLFRRRLMVVWRRARRK